MPDEATSTSVVVPQGAQPTFEDVRVGVVVAAMHEGRAKVRLLIRSWEEKKRVDLVSGEEVDLFGRGTLTVDGIDLQPEGSRDRVSLTFRPADG